MIIERIFISIIFWGFGWSVSAATILSWHHKFKTEVYNTAMFYIGLCGISTFSSLLGYLITAYIINSSSQ